jgi:hypothetical protein
MRKPQEGKKRMKNTQEWEKRDEEDTRRRQQGWRKCKMWRRWMRKPQEEEKTDEEIARGREGDEETARGRKEGWGNSMREE